MKSGHVRALLSSYIDGEIGEADRESIDRHLAECSACRNHLATLQGVVTLTRSIPHVAAPADLGGRILHAIEKKLRPRSLPLALLHIGRWNVARVAVTTAAAVLVGVYALNLVAPHRSSLVYRETTPRGAPLASRGPVQVSAPSVSDAGRAGQPGAPGLGAQAPPPVSGQSLESLRSIIKTARLTLEVESVDAAARRLLSIAEGNGGFIADSSTTEDDSSPQGQFTLRVPAARFAPTIQDIEGLGKVRQRQISAQDVTGQFVDLQARLRNLEHHERQLLLFMDRAERVSDLLAIEQELSRVRGEIEQTTGQINYLSHSVDMATVDVILSQKAPQVSVPLWDVQAALHDMQAALTASVREILLVSERMLVLASALLPLAVIGYVVWLVVLRVRRTGAHV